MEKDRVQPHTTSIMKLFEVVGDYATTHSMAPRKRWNRTEQTARKRWKRKRDWKTCANPLGFLKIVLNIGRNISINKHVCGLGGVRVSPGG